MASFTGGEIASRRPVNSAVAIARLSPSSVVLIRASIVSRRPCMNGRIAQAKPAAGGGRLRGLDRAHHEAGGADAGKKHVAAEIVAARPHRRERRQQPRLQFDKAADRGRRALLHRQPHALELCRPARAFHGDDAQDKTVGALANVAGLDKARQRHRKHRPRQHAMRDPRGLPRRDRKARRDGCDHDGYGKEFLPPQQHRDRA